MDQVGIERDDADFGVPASHLRWPRLVEQRDWAGLLKEGEAQLWASHEAG